MRIVLHDFGGYPFSAQLARALAKRGHQVEYLHAAGFKQPRAVVERRPADPPTLAYRGLDVRARYRSGAGPRRFMQERKYGRLLADAIRAADPDVVLSANCPLDAQAMALEAARAASAGFVFWLQDLYSVALDRLLRRRLGPIGGAIGAHYARLEADLLRRSDAVVSIAPGFQRRLTKWSVAEERVTVIENWAPVEDTPTRPKDNDWSRAHGLGDRPVLLYAGALGRKHDSRLLPALAEALPEARVVVVAEGTGAEALKRASLPPNLVLLPLQPAESVPDVLGTADILLAVLEPVAHTFSVPSKVLTYLAAGRPILAAMPQDNLASQIIESSGAGRVVEPGDLPAIVSAARELLNDGAAREAAGSAARAYAERTFDIDVKVDRFEAVIASIARLTHSVRGRVTDTAATDQTRPRIR